MAAPRTLYEAIRETFDFKKKSAEDFSVELGMSVNSIYRWNQTEDSVGFADLPLRRLLSVLNVSNNNAILDFLEARRGRISVKVPRVTSLPKNDESKMISDYQLITVGAIKALTEFLEKPSRINYLNCDDALKDVLRKTVAIDKYSAKKASGQFEMEFN